MSLISKNIDKIPLISYKSLYERRPVRRKSLGFALGFNNEITELDHNFVLGFYEKLAKLISLERFDCVVHNGPLIGLHKEVRISEPKAGEQIAKRKPLSQMLPKKSQRRKKLIFCIKHKK